MTAVDLENISVRYDEKIVLEHVSLQIEESRIVSIIGPNGSGKSTLLHTILGLKNPFEGKVRIFGLSPEMALKKRRIGFLPQKKQNGFDFPVTVYDVVAMPRLSSRRLFQTLSEKDKTIIRQSLELVEMAAEEKTHFGSLSGGQQQRVLIARTLAMEPSLLLLDEPSTGLDVVAQDQFYRLLQQLRDEKKLTILMVSHDIGAVSDIVDQVACLNRQIHFHGAAKECIPGEALEKVFGPNVQFVFHDRNCPTCRKQHE